MLLAFQFLCGHPQVFWFSTLCQGVFVLVRALQFPLGTSARGVFRSVGQFGAAVAFCLGLVAVVLLPFLELASHGNRSLNSPEYVNFGRLEWLDLFSLFTEPPYKQLVDWEKNFFVGSVVLVAGLAGLSRLSDGNVRGLLAVALAALLLALGDQTPLFHSFYEYIPGYSALRVHCRSGFLIVFALLSAAGLWLGRRETIPGGWIVPSVFASAILVVTLLCFRHETPKSPFGLWMIAVASALLCLLRRTRRDGSDPRVGRIIMGALVVVQVVDLTNANLQGNVHRGIVSGSYGEALDWMSKGQDLRHAAILEAQPTLSLGGHDEAITESVRIAKWAPNAIHLHVETPANALLVLAEAWYPGWKAQVGDATYSSIPANIWMRAFPVPAGKHEVRIFYRQNWLLIGVLISGSSLAMLVFWVRSTPR